MGQELYQLRPDATELSAILQPTDSKIIIYNFALELQPATVAVTIQRWRFNAQFSQPTVSIASEHIRDDRGIETPTPSGFESRKLALANCVEVF